MVVVIANVAPNAHWRRCDQDLLGGNDRPPDSIEAMRLHPSVCACVRSFRGQWQLFVRVGEKGAEAGAQWAALAELNHVADDDPTRAWGDIHKMSAVSAGRAVLGSKTLLGSLHFSLCLSLSLTPETP